MTDYRARYGPHNPDHTYVAHDVPEPRERAFWTGTVGANEAERFDGVDGLVDALHDNTARLFPAPARHEGTQR